MNFSRNRKPFRAYMLHWKVVEMIAYQILLCRGTSDAVAVISEQFLWFESAMRAVQSLTSEIVQSQGGLVSEEHVFGLIILPVSRQCG